MKDKINNNTQPIDTSVNEEEMVEEKKEALRREFTYPKRIKQVKILLAIAQIILGATLIVLPAIYFANPADDSLSLQLLGIIAIIGGAVLVLIFPTSMAKAINSKLILGEQKILFRNSFGWREVLWKDIQEIMITEKLSNDPNTNISIGANYVRFKTISRGYYYFLESYPIEIIKEMKNSLKEVYSESLKNTSYIVQEKHERPSIRSRLVFFEKVYDNSIEVVTEEKENE